VRAVLGALLAPVAVASCSTCGGPLLGPEAEVEVALRRLEQAPPALELPGEGRVELSRASFDRVLVRPEPPGFVAVATVDVEGTLRGTQGETAVACLGRERIPFARSGRGFAPSAGLLPTLSEALSLVLARRRALSSSDPAALERLVARGYRDPRFSREAALALARDRMPEPYALPSRIALRLERGEVEVLEESPQTSESPRQARFTLVREGAALRFASGLL
jgi:hypothetical protein